MRRGEIRARPAAGGSLQQRLQILTHLGNPCLSLARHRGNLSIRRIDDERCASIGEPRRRRKPVLVVSLGDIPFRAALRSIVAAGPRRDVLFDRLGLFLGEHRLVGEFGRPLERRKRVAAPDALQIGLAPRCLRRRKRTGGLRAKHDHRRNRHRDHRQNPRERSSSHCALRYSG